MFFDAFLILFGFNFFARSWAEDPLILIVFWKFVWNISLITKICASGLGFGHLGSDFGSILAHIVNIETRFPWFLRGRFPPHIRVALHFLVSFSWRISLLLGAKIDPRIMKNSIYFSSEVLLDFGMDDGMVLGGFWEENVIKNLQKNRLPKRRLFGLLFSSKKL